jgi:hypothetical protein
MKVQHEQPELSMNRSMPPGVIIPELAYGDMREAVAWLCRAFGFSERLRIGNHRAPTLVRRGFHYRHEAHRPGIRVVRSRWLPPFAGRGEPSRDHGARV